jgi:putative membrane protein
LLLIETAQAEKDEHPKERGMTMQQQTLSQQDRNFVMEAARGGTAEVKLSQLATDRASDEEVRQFAQHMIHDHTQANQELRQLASSEGVTASDELDQEHRNLMNRLSGLKGTEFDRAYMDAMVQDHKKVVAEFEREASQGQDNELKNWASTLLPKLQRHLQMAQDLAEQY